MSNTQTLKEMLGTRLGNERANRIMNGIKYAHENGSRGNQLSVYINGLLKKEGIVGPAIQQTIFVFPRSG